MHARVYPEQVLHLRTVARSNNDKLTAVVLHTLHQGLQCLCSLVIALTRLAQRCQCVGLVNKQNSTNSLVA